MILPNLGRGLRGMIKLKTVCYQQKDYISPKEWVGIMDSLQACSEEDREFVSPVIDIYINKDKPEDFDFIKHVKKYKEYRSRDKEREAGIFEPLYIDTNNEETEIENPLIHRNNDCPTIEEECLDSVYIESIWNELKVLNREIMISHQINLIKLIKRCMAFPSKYTEEFLTLKELVAKLDDIQKEQIITVLSSSHSIG